MLRSKGDTWRFYLNIWLLNYCQRILCKSQPDQSNSFKKKKKEENAAFAHLVQNLRIPRLQRRNLRLVLRNSNETVKTSGVRQPLVNLCPFFFLRVFQVQEFPQFYRFQVFFWSRCLASSFLQTRFQVQRFFHVLSTGSILGPATLPGLLFNFFPPDFGLFQVLRFFPCNFFKIPCRCRSKNFPSIPPFRLFQVMEYRNLF